MCTQLSVCMCGRGEKGRGERGEGERGEGTLVKYNDNVWLRRIQGCED